MASQREIISKTMENMIRIYRDVGHVAQMIEEKMRCEGFKAMGDAAITWEVSTAYSNPAGWLYRWFARVFMREKSSKKAVGYCIHLGDYLSSHEEMLQQMGVPFPFVNVSLLKDFKKEVSTYWRPSIYNAFWGAGWCVDENWVKRDKMTDCLVYGCVGVQDVNVRSITYFLDLLSLTNGDIVTKLIVEPMVKIFNGDEEWVSKNGLPVIRLASASQS